MNEHSGRHLSASRARAWRAFAFVLILTLALCALSGALAYGGTLQVDLQGLRSGGVGEWRSAPITALLEVLVDDGVQHVAIGQLAANAGEAFSLPDGVDGLIFVRVSDDSLPPEFVLTGDVPVTVVAGQRNVVTVYAYERKGYFAVSDTRVEDGSPAAGARYALKNASDETVAAFQTGADGRYQHAEPLPEGRYTLTRTAPAEGTLPSGAVWTVDIVPYTGRDEDIARVAAQSKASLPENDAVGALTLDGGAGVRSMLLTDGAATLVIGGVSDGRNSLPLENLTLTVSPASLRTASDTEIPCDARIASLLAELPAGAALSVQPLSAAGEPVGEERIALSGEPLALSAAAARVTWVEAATGARVVPANFDAGTLTLTYVFPQIGADAGMPAAARVSATETHSYQCPDVDGAQYVTVEGAPVKAEASLPVDDGRGTLAVRLTEGGDGQGNAVTLSLTPRGAERLTEVSVALCLPDGTRVDTARADGDARVVRAPSYDMIILTLDASSGAMEKTFPLLNAMQQGAAYAYILDPKDMPATDDNPLGLFWKADTYVSIRQADLMLGVSGGAYARCAAEVAGAPAQGTSAGGILAEQAMLGGVVFDDADGNGQPDGADGAKDVPVTLYGARTGCWYIAYTDESGRFALTCAREAPEDSGEVSAMLPDNTVSIATNEAGAYNDAALALPAQNLLIGFSRMSRVSGALTVDGEAGPEGVAVQLYAGERLVADAETDASGAFTFDHLSAGAYQVRVAALDSDTKFVLSDGQQETRDGSLHSETIRLTAGGEYAVRAEAETLNTLLVTVAMDGDAHAGVDVTLTDREGMAQTARTGADGAASFAGLRAGAYTLSLRPLIGTAIVDVDGEMMAQKGAYAREMTIGGGMIENVMIRMETTSTVTGRVEGAQAGSEVMAVSVYDIVTTRLSDDGAYTLMDLVSGEYTLYVPRAAERAVSGDDWRLTKEGDRAWLTVAVAAARVLEAPELRFEAVCAISGTAFADAGGKGVRAAGSAALPNLSVALQREADGAWKDIAAAVTDANGAFTFGDLRAGTYRVRALPGEGQFITAVGGGLATDASDTGETLYVSQPIELREGASAAGAADIGVAQSARVLALVFIDSNDSGERGEYERALANVRVEVVSKQNGEERVAASGVTNADGEASLTAFAPGTYAVRFTLPDGYFYSKQSAKQGNRYNCAATVDDVVSETAEIVFPQGELVRVGAGAIPCGEIGGMAFLDDDGNGRMDEGNAGVAGVEITLTGERTNRTMRLVTDETGVWRFSGLREDVYSIAASLPEGMLFADYTRTGGEKRSIFTPDRDTSASRSYKVEVGEKLLNKNIGCVNAASLSGIAFMDMNYNGFFDEGEPGVAGVTVELIRTANDKTVGKTKTDETGLYAFTTLRDGVYRVRAVLPDDGSMFTLTTGDEGAEANRFKQRDGRRENSITEYRLSYGQKSRVVVGVARVASVSGTVFIDADFDGRMRAGDETVGKLAVQLRNEQNQTIAETTTNAAGAYTLSDLMPGVYTLYVAPQSGYAFSRGSEESGGSVIADFVDGYGVSNPFEVVMDTAVTGMNAGMLPNGFVTGAIFADDDDDGRQSAGESGIAGATVSLVTADGETVNSAVTGADGAYSFDSVMPGQYVVRFELPEHAVFANVVSGGNTVSSDSAVGETPMFDFAVGQRYQAPAVGAVRLGEISGRIFHDENGNGVWDDGEEPLAGFALDLAPTRGDLARQSVVTGEDGAFSLSGLRPDTYQFTAALPNGFIFSNDTDAPLLSFGSVNRDERALTWRETLDMRDRTVGAVLPAALYGRVWLDEGRDGRMDAGERMMSGVAFTLIDERTGIAALSGETNAEGEIVVSALRPGDYTLEITLPSQAMSAEEGHTTFADLGGGRLSHAGISLRENGYEENILAGIVSYTTIAGRAWLDRAGSEEPVAGLLVTLYDESGAPVATATTGADGGYAFGQLYPARYRVGAAISGDRLFVTPDDDRFTAADNAIISTENGVGYTDWIELRMAEDRLDTNIGMVMTGEAGDYAWLDLNENGLMDLGEPGISGIVVSLWRNGEKKFETTTDSYGYYLLPNVYPGTYRLEAETYSAFVATKRVDALRMFSTCLDGQDGNTAYAESVVIRSGEKDFTLDLGFCLRSGERVPAGVTDMPERKWK